MEFLSGILPWLLGGLTIIGVGGWLLQSGKLHEWLPNIGSARQGNSPGEDDYSHQQQQKEQQTQERQEGRIRIDGRDGNEMSLVLNADNSVAFMAQGDHSKEQATRFMESASNMSLTTVTGNVGVTHDTPFHIIGIGTRRMEKGSPVIRRVRFIPDDHHDIPVGNDGILDLNTANARSVLNTLRGNEGLASGDSRVHVTGNAAGFASTIVINQLGRAIYRGLSNAGHSLTYLADPLDEPSTVITGEVDPTYPTKFRISSFTSTTVSGTHRDRSSTTISLCSIPLQDRPTLAVSADGFIDLASPAVQEQLRQIRISRYVVATAGTGSSIRGGDLGNTVAGMLTMVTGGQSVTQRTEGLPSTPLGTMDTSNNPRLV